VEWSKELEARWQQLAEEVMIGMKEWRLQHPKATFREIEAALDERLARVRARMLEDVALASAAADVSSASQAERPQCPNCGNTMESRGQDTRKLTTNYNQTVTLRRSYATCPVCGTGFSPLDEELKLLPGSFTPSLVESAVRLGTWMPFLPTAKMLAHFTKVEISKAIVRRDTEKAGQAYVEVQTRQLEALEKELPESPPGPPVQQVSVDGAYVPLRGKDEWAEVKTLAIGTVKEPILNKEGEWEIHAKEVSYFSRLADHKTFGRLATIETHRRGTEKAGVVCGVNDGADWEQKFLDLHRPDAVRILDWGHAAEYVVKAGQAVFGAGASACSEWLGTQLHELRHGDPEKVLSDLRGLKKGLVVEEGGESSPSAEGLEVVAGSLDYLEKRWEQIQYAEFVAKGYPIGSGMVESANKLVVEARLKGSGMHWARENVNPMVALRTVACSDRWEEAWPQISERLRQQAKESAERRRGERRTAKETMVVEPSIGQENQKQMTELSTTVGPTAMEPILAQAGLEPTTCSSIPAANHPWRRMRIGKAIWAGPRPTVAAET